MPLSPIFQAEVERQLQNDFYYYAGKDCGSIKIDWSEVSIEGHDTQYFGDDLENYCGLLMRDDSGAVIAWGWMDFIYVGGDEPLFTFWAYLHLGHPEEDRPDVVQSRWIPQHIWDRLPESTKDRCSGPEAYDTCWCKDPLVLQWEELRSRK